MTIPFVDLKAQYLTIKDEIDEAIKRVVDNTGFIMGEEVESFEKEFAEFCGVKYAIAVSSGTDALHLALLACGIKNGDEVITVPNTFIATTEAISHCGAKPVFVDINEDYYTIDVKKIEDKITPATKAILPVHLYGQPADMDGILDIAKKYGLKVIEDAAQAHAAEYKGRKVGAIGDVGCFSFFPGKNLGAYGDGGMVITSNKKIADHIGLLRNHGREKKYEHLIEGYCNRLDALQAAILRVKLKYLGQWTEARIKKAQLYNNLLIGINNIVTPKVLNGAKHVYHLYVIKAKNRELLQKELKKSGVASGVHYPIPLHLQLAYQRLGYKEGDFLSSEKVSKEILSLPMFPELMDSQIEEIVEIVKRVS